jgi:hypothetical protein
MRPLFSLHAGSKSGPASLTFLRLEAGHALRTDPGIV